MTKAKQQSPAVPAKPRIEMVPRVPFPAGKSAEALGLKQSLWAVFVNQIHTCEIKGGQEDLFYQAAMQVLVMCNQYEVDPLKKGFFHIVPPFGDTRNFQVWVGIDLQIFMAEKSKVFAGLGDEEFAPDLIEVEIKGRKFKIPSWCRVAVKKKIMNDNGTVHSVVDCWGPKVFFKEALKQNKQWKESPRMMVQKTALSFALRRNFSEVGGLPLDEVSAQTGYAESFESADQGKTAAQTTATMGAHLKGGKQKPPLVVEDAQVVEKVPEQDAPPPPTDIPPPPPPPEMPPAPPPPDAVDAPPSEEAPPPAEATDAPKDLFPEA